MFYGKIETVNFANALCIAMRSICVQNSFLISSQSLPMSIQVGSKNNKVDLETEIFAEYIIS